MKKLKKFLKRANPKITIIDLAESLNWSINQSPSNILKNRHELIIDEELSNLKERKGLKYIFYVAIILSGICLLSSYIFLTNTPLKSLVDFFLGTSILLLFCLITARLTISFKTIRKFEKLLFEMRWNKKLFSENSTSPEKITKQITDLALKMEKGIDPRNNKIELFDTRTLTILIDVFNNINHIPKFNEIYYADLVRKITGCSDRRFRDFIKDPYSETHSAKRCRELIKKLEIIKVELNKIEYHNADDYINKKINSLNKKIKEIKKTNET